jgi:hypothetical protein
MQSTPIFYQSLIRPIDIYSVHALYHKDYNNLSLEMIQHENYTDLLDKIRARFQQLLNLGYVPLFEIKCEYFRANPIRSTRVENLTEEVYNSIDWGLLENRGLACFTARYYTLQGVDHSSSSDDGNTSGSSAASE